MFKLKAKWPLTLTFFRDGLAFFEPMCCLALNDWLADQLSQLRKGDKRGKKGVRKVVNVFYVS